MSDERVKVCDCPNCPCAAEVDREGQVCEGCASGERCAELKALPRSTEEALDDLRVRYAKLQGRYGNALSRLKHPEYHVPTGGGKHFSRRSTDSRRLQAATRRLEAMAEQVERLQHERDQICVALGPYCMPWEVLERIQRLKDRARGVK